MIIYQLIPHSLPDINRRKAAGRTKNIEGCRHAWHKPQRHNINNTKQPHLPTQDDNNVEKKELMQETRQNI